MLNLQRPRLLRTSPPVLATARSHREPPSDIAMGLSKSTRILILLTIDALFFLLEISVGEYA